MRGPMKEKVLKLRQTLSLFGYRMPTLSARKLSDISSTEIEGIAASLSLADITRVLFRCHDEEQAEDSHSGVYDIPEHGRLVYCGLAGGCGAAAGASVCLVLVLGSSSILPSQVPCMLSYYSIFIIFYSDFIEQKIQEMQYL
jgi:hypothetical protein